MGFPGGLDQQELAPEADGERHADQAEAGDGHAEAERDMAAALAGDVFEGFGGGAGAAVARREKHEDAEGGGVHDAVGGEVEDDAGQSIALDFGALRVAGDVGVCSGQRREPSKHVTAVGNRAVGEQAFEVVLEEAQDIAEGHREHGHDPEQADDLRREGPVWAADGVHNFDESDKAAGFGDEGKERGDGRGGALIDVAGVDVQRNGGDLEGESGHQHYDGEHGPGGCRRC